MVCEPISENAKHARRRYVREMAVSAVLYVALVFGAALVIRNVDTPQWARIVLSLLPTAPALLMLRAYLTYLNALDEFQRRLQTDALLIATGVTVFGTFAYGFLEEWADLPHVPLIWVFPLFSFVFGAAHAIIRHRYK
jgi:cation transport ATPase